MSHLAVTLTEDALDPMRAHVDFFALHGHDGAVASFTGVVRGRAAGRVVDYLYLDWYPGMSEASLRNIGEAALARFDITGAVIRHRCGRVEAGEPVVFVAAASSHRRAAFDAVDFMMDKLKSEAALWKREAGQGLDHWIEPTKDDAKTLKRWQE